MVAYTTIEQALTPQILVVLGALLVNKYVDFPLTYYCFANVCKFINFLSLLWYAILVTIDYEAALQKYLTR